MTLKTLFCYAVKNIIGEMFKEKILQTMKTGQVKGQNVELTPSDDMHKRGS